MFPIHKLVVQHKGCLRMQGQPALRWLNELCSHTVTWRPGHMLACIAHLPRFYPLDDILQLMLLLASNHMPWRWRSDSTDANSNV